MITSVKLGNTYACILKSKEPIENILSLKLGSVYTVQCTVCIFFLVVEQVSETTEIVRRDGADGQQVRHLS
jgi:hypothetical protein